MIEDKEKQGIETDSYDGVNITKYDNGVLGWTMDLQKALEQDNFRNVFLSGQLFIEDDCDEIILKRFDYKGELFLFLKSRDIDFFGKINLVKQIIGTLGGTIQNEVEKEKFSVISSNVNCSLQAIAEVRNAFQHNLIKEHALEQVRRGGKFAFVNKMLKDYQKTEDLLNDFRIETLTLHCKLGDILLGLSELNKK